MTRWEYFTAPILVHASQQILNNFGADGLGELVLGEVVTHHDVPS